MRILINLFLILCNLPLLIHGQGLYADFEFSYGQEVMSRPLNDNVTYFYSPLQGVNEKTELVYGSYGKGFYYGASIGSVSKKATVLQLDLGYFHGLPQQVFTRFEFSDGTVEERTETDYGRYYYINPMLGLQVDVNEKNNLLILLGPTFVKGTHYVYFHQLGEIFEPRSFEFTLAHHNGLDIGGKFEISYEHSMGKNFAMTYGLSYQILNFVFEKAEVTQLLVDGVDGVDDMTAENRYFEYSDSYSKEIGVDGYFITDPDKPTVLPRMALPYNALQASVALRFYLKRHS